MYKIIDEQNRKKLMEGRNYGIGYAFLEKKEDIYHTIQPISPCKDYLNDVVFSEMTGKPCTAFGLSTKKLNIFDNDFAYLTIKICKKGNAGINIYQEYEGDITNLQENYKNIEKLINFYEEKLNKEYTKGGRTRIFKSTTKDLFFVKLNKMWVTTTYGISLVSFLIRIGLRYDGKTTPEDFVMNFKHNQAETYLFNDIKQILSKLVKKGEIPEQDYNQICTGEKGTATVHNYGIIYFKKDVINNKKIKL